MHKKNILASKVLVAKIMKQNNIRSIVQKRFKVTTDSSHKYPVVENVLDRNFTTKEQNKAWVSDITYVATEQGWLYLTSVIDLFDRKVIGWALSNTMKAKDTTLQHLKWLKSIGQYSLINNLFFIQIEEYSMLVKNLQL